MVKIMNNEQLKKWLLKSNNFADGYIYELGPMIKDNYGNEIVKFKIGIQTKGSWKAGSKANYKEYELEAKGIKRWTYGGDKIDEKMGIIDMTNLNNSNKLGIRINLYGSYELECDEIHISSPRIIKTQVQAYVSDYDFRANFTLNEIPKPKDWIEWLRNEGVNASWRYYGSKLILPKEVPYPDYSGWFIQKADRIESTKGGIFFYRIKKFKLKNEIILQNVECDDNLWKTITMIIARLPNTRILSGNITLTGEQWLSYLIDGKLPE